MDSYHRPRRQRSKKDRRFCRLLTLTTERGKTAGLANAHSRSCARRPSPRRAESGLHAPHTDGRCDLAGTDCEVSPCSLCEKLCRPSGGPWHSVYLLIDSLAEASKHALPSCRMQSRACSGRSASSMHAPARVLMACSKPPEIRAKPAAWCCGSGASAAGSAPFSTPGVLSTAAVDGTPCVPLHDRGHRVRTHWSPQRQAMDGHAADLSTATSGWVSAKTKSAAMVMTSDRRRCIVPSNGDDDDADVCMFVFFFFGHAKSRPRLSVMRGCVAPILLLCTAISTALSAPSERYVSHPDSLWLCVPSTHRFDAELKL